MNLFASRGEVAGDMSENTTGVISRSYIQACYIVTMVLMMTKIMGRKIGPTLRPVALLALIIIINIVYWNYIENVEFTLSIYIRILTNFAALIYLYGIPLHNDLYRKHIQFFCITLLVSLCVKILTSGVYTNEKLGAGDTASIGLVFLIPLMIRFFKVRVYLIFVAIAVFFIFLSVRRTSIIAVLISLMCFVNFRKFKFKYALWGIILMLGSLYYAQRFVGNQLETRFGVMISHDKTESIGSGREDFYVDLLDSYFESNTTELLLGHGLGAVYRHFAPKGMGYLNHAHNDYLEILYTFGFVGLLIWCVFVLQLFRIWKKAPHILERKIFFSALLGYLAISFLSGCLIRIETLPFMITIADVLPRLSVQDRNGCVSHNKSIIKHEDHLLFS